MLEKIVEWGKKEDAVKALFLLGSRTGRQPVDNFSDYDLSVFCNTDESYTGSDSWLTQFGNVLVCIKEKVFYKGVFCTTPNKVKSSVILGVRGRIWAK